MIVYYIHSLWYLLVVPTLLTHARSVMSPTTRTSPTAQNSHLLFYLTVEKQLMPQTAILVDRVLELLTTQCSRTYSKTSECFAAAKQLPPIPFLYDFPSKGTLQKEGSKLFTKHLLKDTYNSLYRLQALLEEENEGVRLLTDLTVQMQQTRELLKSELETHFKIRLRENPTKLIQSKRRYVRLSRTGKRGNCRKQNDNDDCLTEEDYRLRLLYTANERLLRINHVLTYTVRLSWLNLEHNTWP